jgi:hypothetical protein
MEIIEVQKDTILKYNGRYLQVIHNEDYKFPILKGLTQETIIQLVKEGKI